MKYALGSLASAAGMLAGAFVLLAGEALPVALVVVFGTFLLIQVGLIIRTLRTRT